MSWFNFIRNKVQPENDKVNANEDVPSTVDQETEETYELLEREILPAKIICPDCGGITLEGLEFCDKCGGELQ